MTASSMRLPVAARELLEWIPHREPMVWIDQVTEVRADGGTATITLRKDAMYMSGGVLRPSSFIEFLAQAFGFIGICREVFAEQKGEGRPAQLKKAFLVAVRDADVLVDRHHAGLRPGEILVIKVSAKKNVGSIQLTDGRVETLRGETLMTGHLKVYAEYKKD